MTGFQTGKSPYDEGKKIRAVDSLTGFGVKETGQEEVSRSENKPHLAPGKWALDPLRMALREKVVCNKMSVSNVWNEEEIFHGVHYKKPGQGARG
ncbi:hypothetical protein M8J77_002298 [Diaphorina citri]|nr:hypothetical protein M8J77_002298 [Diaphorina citri]